MSIGRLQSRQTSAGGTFVGSLSLAFSSAVTAASVLHAFGSYARSAPFTSTVFQDNNSNTWGLTLDSEINPGGSITTHGSTQNANAGATTVTVTWPGQSFSFPSIWIIEYGNAATTGQPLQHNASVSSSTTSQATTVTLTSGQAPALLSGLSCNCNTGETPTPDATFTADGANPGWDFTSGLFGTIACNKRVTGTGAQTMTNTQTSADALSSHLAAFMEASGGGAAALAGGATVATAVSAVLSTGIKLASSVAVSAAVSGFLMQMSASASVTAVGAGVLNTAIKLASAAITGVSSSATLGGSVLMQGAAAAATSATAVLINFTTVTLSGTQYTGPGGIYDPHLWQDSVPHVGSVIYYDATHLTISPNGELSGDVQDFSAVIGFYDDAGQWAPGIVFFTSGLAVYADTQTAAIGALTTAIVLGAAASALVNAAGSLNAQIGLTSAVNAITTAVAALITAIPLAANSIGASAATGQLSGSVNSLSAAVVSTSTFSAFLSAQITLLSASSALVSAAGNLATQIKLQSASLTTVSAGATLITNTQLAAQVQAAAAASGALITGIRMTAAAIAIIQASGALSTHVQMVGAAVASSTASGALTTFTGLVASVQQSDAATAQLTALISMQSSGFAISQAAADLLTHIPLSSGVLQTDSAQGALTSTGSPSNIYPIDPAFVIGVRRQIFTEQFQELSPNDQRVLTFNFSDSLGDGETLQGVVSIDVRCTAGDDPAPSAVLFAPAAYDQTLHMVEQPFKAGSADNDYYFTVTAPTTNPYKTITRFGLLSVRA